MNYNFNNDVSEIAKRFKKNYIPQNKQNLTPDTYLFEKNYNNSNNNSSQVYNINNLSDKNVIDYIEEIKQQQYYLLPDIVISEREKPNLFKRVFNTARDVVLSVEQASIKSLESGLDAAAGALGFLNKEGYAFKDFNIFKAKDELGAINDIDTGLSENYEKYIEAGGKLAPHNETGLIGTAPAGYQGALFPKLQANLENFIAKDLTDELIDTNVYNFRVDPVGTLQGKYGSTNATEEIMKNSFIPEEHFVREVSQSFGQMLPSVALSYVNPALGTVAFGLTAGGSALEEGIANGATFEEAFSYAGAVALIETLIEKTFTGIQGAGKGLIDTALQKSGNALVAKVSNNSLFKFALGVIGEGAEEVTSEFIDPYLRKVTIDPDAPTASNEDLLKSFVIGAATSALMQGANSAILRKVNKNKIDIKAELNEIQNLINYQTEAYNKGRFGDAEKLAAMIEKKSQRLGDKLGLNEELSVAVKEAQTISKLSSLEKASTKKNSSKYENVYKNIENSLSEDLKQMDKKKRIEFINKNKLNYMFNQDGNLKQNYKKLTQEQKNKANEVKSVINKLDSKANVNFIYANKNNQGYFQRNTNTITINLNATDPYRTVGMHEFIHSLEKSQTYQDFKDFIVSNLQKRNRYKTEFDSLSSLYKNTFEETSAIQKLQSAYQKQEISKEEYNTKYEELLKNYVEEEMVAKIASEEIFSNDKVIKDLVGENRSLGKRILNWIKEKLNKKEPEYNEWSKELKTAKKLFEKALAEKKESSEEETKYSLKDKKSDEIFSDEEFDKIYDLLLEEEIEEELKQLSKSSEEDLEDLQYDGEVDVEGRELTEEQQMYFRHNHPYMFDEKGRLKVLYHGTKSAGFTVFDPRTSDIGNYRFGKNIVNFFTDSLYMASSYTESGEQEIFNFNNRTFEQVKKDIEIYSKFCGNPLTLKYGKDLKIKNNNIEKNKLYYEDQFGLVYTGPYENLEEVKTEGMRFLRDTFGLLDEEYASFDTINQYLHQGEIYEVYALIQNPFIVDGESRMWNNIINPFKSEFDKISKINFEELEKKVNSSNVENYKDLEKYLSDNGIEFVTQVLDTKEMFEIEDETIIENKEVRIKLKLFDTVYMFTSYLRIEKNGKNINKNFNMKKEELIEQIKNKIQYVTTNDIVSKVLEINKKVGNTYDGIIIKKIYDYGKIGHMMLGNPEDVFITISSEKQIKSVDNKNPMYKNKDIRYSLKEKKTKAPNVKNTKDIPATYVKGKAEYERQKVYSKREATGIYEELIHNIANESGIAIDKNVEKNVINYIYQQLNTNKATSIQIADKVIDYIMKESGLSKGNLPIEYEQNLIKDFRDFIATEAFYGGKLSFRTKMENKISNLKYKLNYQTNLFKEAKKIVNIISKLKEASFKEYQYTAGAEQISDMLKKGVTILKDITISNFNKPETRDIIQKLRNDWYNEQNDLLDIDKDIVEQFNKIITNINSKEVLSIEEIVALRNILNYMSKTITDFDKVRINGKKESISEMASKAIEKVENTKSTSKNKVSKTYRKFVVKPSTYFRSIEGTVLQEEGVLNTLLVKEIRRSETKFYENVMKLMKPFDDFFENNKKYKNKLSKKTINIAGKQVKLKEAISIYLLSLREQARGHFMSDVDKNAKGINFYDDKGAFLYKLILTQEDIDALYKEFDAEDVKYMSLVKEFFNKAARDLKVEADIANTGSTNILEENYYPIITDSIVRYKNLGDPKSKNLDSLFGLYFNEDIVEGANSEIKMMGVDTMVFSHLQKVSRYNAYMEVVKNIRQVLNKKVVSNTDNNEKKALLQVIEEKNPGFTTYLDKFLRDSVTSVKLSSDESKFLSSIRKNYASFALGMKFSTVANQFTIIPTAINVLSPKSLLKVNNVKLGWTDNQMDVYCPYAKYRNYSGNIKSSEINIESSLNTIQDKMLWFMAAADRQTVKYIWRACQIEAKDKYGYEFGSKQNLEKAGELLEETLRETQALDTSEQTELFRTDSDLVKWVLLFQKQNVQTLSTITDYISQYRTIIERIKVEGKTEANKAKLKEINIKGAKALAGLLTSALSYTLVAMLFKKILHKDDEEKNDLLEIGQDFLGNVVGMVPLFNMVYSKFFNGYDMKLSVLDMFNDGADALTGMYDSIRTGNFENSWYKFANAFGMATGIPTKNILEYGTALIGTFNPDLAYKYRGIFYNKTVSEYTNDFEKSLKSGDSKSAKSILEQIYNEKHIDIDSEIIQNIYPVLKSYKVKNASSVFPKTANQTVTYDSTEYKMSDKQYKRFKDKYTSNINTYVKTLVRSSKYFSLKDDEKAQAIKYVQDFAYFKAVQEILKVDTSDSTKLNLLSGVIRPEIIAIVLAKCKGTLKGDKAAIQRYINSLSVPREQKYILYGLLGYKPIQENAYVQVSNYLTTKGYSVSKIQKVLEKCKLI